MTWIELETVKAGEAVGGAGVIDVRVIVRGGRSVSWSIELIFNFAATISSTTYTCTASVVNVGILSTAARKDSAVLG